MICVTKHTFFDQKYVLTIQNEQIRIGKENQDAKYIIPLNLTIIIQWMVDKVKMKFLGFMLKVRGKVKKFHMSHLDCLSLKNQIDGKIMYNDINSLYFPVQVIGEGSFGKVIKVVNQLTKQEFACKVMKLDKQFCKNDIIYELKTMQSLNNDNIIKIKEVFSSTTHFFVIMEYCRGGSLKDYQICYQLQNQEIIYIIKTILKVVIYMNEQGYIHRDLKPENILLRTENDLSSILICDFGFAAKLEDIQTKHPNCGTPGYIAPEVVKYDEDNPYNHQCDVFSCGSILYSLLTGKQLSISSDIDIVYNIDEQVQIVDEQFCNIKKEFLNILLMMLNLDPLQRITAIDALKYFDQFDDIISEDYICAQEIKVISINKNKKNNK